jgi:transposase
MMGRLTAGQVQFFYAFHLDKVVPADHVVRRIDAVLDLGWIHKEFAPFYSNTGRPSIDPELMIRMLLVGYIFAIRSERRICAEVQVNLAYRWFCRLSIEDHIPDHAVFSRARTRPPINRLPGQPCRTTRPRKPDQKARPLCRA